jgi:hypothetical protein
MANLPFEVARLVALEKYSAELLSDPAAWSGRHGLAHWKCTKCKQIIHISFDQLKHRGCPNCRPKLVSEEYVRSLFCWLFPGKRFPKLRPPALKGLELDGFNEALLLAFEYQGAQHTQEGVFRNASLKQIQQRDRLKKVRCREAGITLIEITHDTPRQLLEEVVRKSLRDNGVTPENKEPYIPHYSPGLGKPHNVDIEELLRLSGLSRREGSDENSFSIICATCGYKSRTSAKQLEARTRVWLREGKLLNCKKCASSKANKARAFTITANELRAQIDKLIQAHEYQAFPESQHTSFQPLRDRYVYADLLSFKCPVPSHHPWSVPVRKLFTGSSIRIQGRRVTGQWCPECGGKVRISREEIVRILHEKGLNVLGVELKDTGAVVPVESVPWTSKTIVKIKCPKNHAFGRPANQIKYRPQAWCPDCKKTRRMPKGLLQQKAEGKLIVIENLKDYRNRETPLRCRCMTNLAHTFTKTLNRLRQIRGPWCPYCAEMRT